jgi:hypothetical protein
MTAVGQKQTSRHPWAMSALPPKADTDRRARHVRLVPKAAVSRCSNSGRFSNDPKRVMFR